MLVNFVIIDVRLREDLFDEPQVVPRDHRQDIVAFGSQYALAAGCTHLRAV